MGVVSLQINEPENNRNYIGAGGAHLRGELLSSGHGTLFFKWYSNLSAAPLGATLDFVTTLPLGSQVLSLSAKDQAGDSIAELQSVQHAGMAGGPPSAAPQPCLVHVLIADPRAPLAGATLSKANSLLSAQAPSQWGGADYQNSVNRLRYHWRFSPSGPPAGREPADFMPALTFDGSGAVPVVKYQGALPAELGLGAYALTLRVERSDDPAIGHEVSRNVLLTA